MNGYNFTDRVRRGLQMAREEAARLHHEYVGTEHILLALLDDPDSVAMGVIANLAADPTELRSAVEKLAKPGKADTARPDLPYTSRAKKVLEFAMAEARDLAHSYVGTEHLLLGLLREEKGIAAQVLRDFGVSVDAARAEMLRLLQSRDIDPAHRALLAQGPDQQFKTAVALIELHRIRFGEYPASLQDLQFLGSRDQSAIQAVQYQRLPDGYALDFVAKGQHLLRYPPEFWHGLGVRLSNVGPSTDS